ncbi:MAG TPA: ion transporter [Aliidongia sp.]|nr:ion transporter [Aliidongia sp.]
MGWLIRLRGRVSAVLDHDVPPTGVSRFVNIGLAVLIVINVSSIILESVERIRIDFDPAFWWIEQIATTVFAIEYVLRVWSSVDRVNGEYRHPVQGRLHYATRPFAVIDLVAILPAILGMLGADDLRVLRLLRLLRMLKLSRHSTTFSLLWAVFREESRSIGAVLFLFALTLILSASVMYMVEGDAQPENFSSIPAAMWWAIETLTTVGYGDMVPITPLGKLLGGFVSIIGIGTLALFSGVLTVSFMDQLRLRREHLRRMVEAGMATGPMTPADILVMEDLGKRMGVPVADTDEIVLEAIEEEGRICPHCGQPMQARQDVE